MRGLAAFVISAVVSSSLASVAHAAAPACLDPNNPSCDQHAVTADQAAGEFHGLIMVPGQPEVLDAAAHGGTQAGCGDCSWELILACLQNGAGQTDQGECTGSAKVPKCSKGQVAYRLYLSTNALKNQLVDVLCLGGTNDIVPVGDIAAADVQRYLKDVKPPDITVNIDPDNGVPAGLPAYFWVKPPSTGAAQFGKAQVSEAIMLKLLRFRWSWGDGQTADWTTNAGAPYPDGTVTHTYARSDHYAGQVTIEWGGTYTITVAGETFGPYNAIGTITGDEPFTITVLKAHSTLVSHG
jgi:hypothetical protein